MFVWNRSIVRELRLARRRDAKGFLRRAAPFGAVRASHRAAQTASLRRARRPLQTRHLVAARHLRFESVISPKIQFLINKFSLCLCFFLGKLLELRFNWHYQLKIKNQLIKTQK